MERRVSELEKTVKRLDTFMIQTKVQNKLTEALPNKVNVLETEVVRVKGRCANLESATETNEEDISKLVDEEKDKVKAWKRTTIALGTFILGVVINLITKGTFK